MTGIGFQSSPVTQAAASCNPNMEDHRTPQHDGSDQYSKKAATSDTTALLSNQRARAGFTALFGDATVDTTGVIGQPTFHSKTHVRDLDGSDEAYITGRAVSLSEVA